MERSWAGLQQPGRPARPPRAPAKPPSGQAGARPRSARRRVSGRRAEPRSRQLRRGSAAHTGTARPGCFPPAHRHRCASRTSCWVPGDAAPILPAKVRVSSLKNALDLGSRGRISLLKVVMGSVLKFYATYSWKMSAHGTYPLLKKYFWKS